MKTYKVPQNGLSMNDYYDFVNTIPTRFNDENNRSLQIANEQVTLDGEFLTDEFELVNS